MGTTSSTRCRTWNAVVTTHKASTSSTIASPSQGPAWRTRLSRRRRALSTCSSTSCSKARLTREDFNLLQKASKLTSNLKNVLSNLRRVNVPLKNKITILSIGLVNLLVRALEFSILPFDPHHFGVLVKNLD